MTCREWLHKKDIESWYDYIKNDVQTIEGVHPFILNASYGFTTCKPTIDRVIFNNPATIILWTDGTKTVVRCQEGDTYDEEKGFMAAYLKKLLGNDNTFNKEIKKYCIEAYLPDYLKED